MLHRALAQLLAPLAVAAWASASFAADPAAFKSERISVETRGSGPDVILIPGLGSSPEVWEGTVRAVEGYRYHLVQVAGFAGASAGANADGPVIAPVAEEITRYIEEAELDAPALVGHSMGGTLAMTVATRHPDAVSKVMVVDMLPFLGILFGPPGTTAETVEPVAAQMRTRLANLAGQERRTAVEAAIAAMVRDESQREQPVTHSLDSVPAVSGQAMYDLITTDLRPELKKLEKPLTVLWVRAPNAPITEEQMGMIYRMSYANAPQVELKHIPDAYHFIMFDAPERFQSELRSFLAGK